MIYLEKESGMTDSNQNNLSQKKKKFIDVYK